MKSLYDSREYNYYFVTQVVVYENHFVIYSTWIKVGLSPSKKICIICFIESPLKMIKNVFYFILEPLFVFKISKFSSWLFGHVEKMAWLERSG